MAQILGGKKMPDILKFEWIRYSTYNIILDGKKIGVIDPNYSERKKSSGSFEDDFDGNREIAKTRLIRTFFEFFLPSNRMAAAQ